MTKDHYLRRSPVRFDQLNYQAAYEYWLKLKGDRRSPVWRQWDWFELPVRMIPYFLVVDVRYDPLDFVYRFWGTASTDLHGKDFTGLSISEIRSPGTFETTQAQYLEVVECHEAVGSEYRIQAGENGLPYVQTSLRMPFSGDGARVTQIATYVDWSRDHKEIKEAHSRAFGGSEA
ncbi:MAG: hypothetical protein JJ900_15855 [Rhodospirillales bacterium]|nr:hypothetical protein [Rhodospirillales bacterium]MBO6788322.1 hypothetical protein [Rhodospirillales bacterium]